MKRYAITLASVIAFTLAPRVALAACADLAQLTLPTTTITSASVVAAGTFKGPGGGPAAAQAVYAKLPEFCRVAATLRPSADSVI